MPIALPETMITTYLEMTAREEFQPSFLNVEELAAQGAIILPMGQFDASFYRFLYREVGGHWRWYMRRDLSDEALGRAARGGESAPRCPLCGRRAGWFHRIGDA